MVRDEVFVHLESARSAIKTHLDHGRQRLSLILQLGLSANPNYLRIVRCARNHPVQRVGLDRLSSAPT
jgi:hypothetical protein